MSVTAPPANGWHWKEWGAEFAPKRELAQRLRLVKPALLRLRLPVGHENDTFCGNAYRSDAKHRESRNQEHSAQR